MNLGQLRLLLSSKRVGNVFVVIFLLLCVYFFGYRHVRFFRVPSGSMEPTLQPVDQLVTIAESSYGRGDIVVLRDPAEPGAYLVKRIVGVGGDAISVQLGALQINGEYASEPYLLEPPLYQVMPPVSVPEDHVFILGDNRNNSMDSHDEGECFPVSLIVGRAIFIYFPYERWGKVSSYPLTNRLGE
ncbi:MAG: signal peptidase I [Candidatus Hydrogenedentes bacterium]|nr:signal peptidase I [Candidatus Hydrogenedentota bacterium]